MPPTTLFGLGYGTGPAGYGYPPGARRPSISYPDSPFTWYDHVEITAALPTNGGGPITNYSVLSGSLPAGVSLNATTGELTGTPTTQQSAASVVIRARGPGGVSDTTISVEVLAMPLSLGSSLAAWYKADAGCYTDAACLFASASSQYLSRSNAAILKGAAASWWKAGFFKLTSTGVVHTLFDCTGTNTGCRLRVSAGNAMVVSAGSGSLTQNVTHGTSLSSGTWYFFYAQYDGVNLGLSLNAGTIETAALATYSPGSEANFYVGADSNYMDGALARFSGGDGTLSGAQITALYNAGSGLFYADLPADIRALTGFSYNLCEASSTRVDSVGALNLTPTNGPTVAAGPGEGACVDNSPCKRREDQSGNGFHELQTDIDKQRIWIASGQNGKPVLRGNGTSQYGVVAHAARLSMASHVYIFTAGKTGVGTGHSFIAKGQSTVSFNYGHGDIANALKATFNNVDRTGPAISRSTFYILDTDQAESETVFGKNGVETTAAGAPDVMTKSSLDIGVGALPAWSNHRPGDDAEIIIAGSVAGTTISAAQKASARAYLNSKYAVY